MPDKEVKAKKASGDKEKKSRKNDGDGSVVRKEDKLQKENKDKSKA